MEFPNFKKEYKNNYSNSKLSSGFTLVEILITLSILVLVVLVAVTISVSAIKSQKGNRIFREVQDNGRYITEMMIKEIRMSKIQIPSDDPNYNPEDPRVLYNLTLIQNVTEKTVIYSLDNGSNLIRNTNETGQLPVNSDRVKVNNLKFYISGVPTVQLDSGYRRVTFFMELASTEDSNIKIDLQTTVCSRPAPCPQNVCVEVYPTATPTPIPTP